MYLLPQRMVKDMNDKMQQNKIDQHILNTFPVYELIQVLNVKKSLTL